MIGIVLVTHAQLGDALLSAGEFVLGAPIESAQAVSINLKESATKLRDDIAKAIKNVNQNQGVLILTDMFGGTPSNLSYSFLEEGRVEVMSGVNLPVLLRAVKTRLKEGKDIRDVALEVEAYGKKSICLASGILKGNKTDQ